MIYRYTQYVGHNKNHTFHFIILFQKQTMLKFVNNMFLFLLKFTNNVA